MLIWTSEIQAMAKRKARSQTASLAPDHKKLGIDPIYLVARGVRHIIESSRQELQLCFRLHLDLRFARKVMGLQSRGSRIWHDFGTLTQESQERKAIWM